MTEQEYRLYYYTHRWYNIIIISKPTIFEAWLQKFDIGIMQYMFGVPKEDITLSDFIKMVEANIHLHITLYKERFDKK